ncbi:MAG: threonine synthase [Pseudomonadota bacterium]|nr:threonine synthase [Pseudomonadota bacterium]
MKYVSTRGQATPVDFVEACLTGLAPDGGLYVPEHWPQIAPAQPHETYVEVATRILKVFAGESIPEDDMAALCARAYSSFSHHAVAPLSQAGPNTFVMELHHGPTLAFKDVAMQFIGQLYDLVLKQRGQRMSVVCATSGDTGGAAAAAFAGASQVDLYILHPHERVSPVQRLFMTTTGAENVHNLAVEGDFDDCQAMVKAMFADTAFSQEVALSGVNSINWARIAAQAVYYATTQAALGPDRPIRFVVPSGNMGDAFAGYVAARCGLLAGFETVCAVNENKTLATLLEDGEMRRDQAVATPSPAMDISVPSNFERLLFEVAGRDGDVVRRTYDQYKQAGSANLPDQVRGPLGCTGFKSAMVSNADTLQEMREFKSETGGLICPHTAVGTAAARRLPQAEACTVILSTAHAAKFPETVLEATGDDAPLPTRCESLKERGEAFERVPNDLGIIKDYIRANIVADA